jgi:hypothetical protein
MSNESSRENDSNQTRAHEGSDRSTQDRLDTPEVDAHVAAANGDTTDESMAVMLLALDQPDVEADTADGHAYDGFERLKEVPKPVIQVGPGTLNDSIEHAEVCLADTGRYFQRGGSIVTVSTDPSTGEVVAKEANKSSLARDLDRLADWYKKTSAGKWVHSHPPDRVCASLLDAHQHEHLDALTGMAHQPFLRPDGTLCAASGYDRATGVLAGFDELQFEVATHATPGQAKAALGLLDGLLHEFAFAADTDRSAALSAMLTAAVRPSLTGAPMFHVRAHQAGTGKSYLCRVISAFATSRQAKPMPFPGGDVECGKVLLSALKNSPAVIEFDNLTTDLLPHDSLCSALTAENFSSRNLGHSQMKSVGTRSVFMSSGNNVGPVGDMSRRCITINLDAACEMPATRTFKNPGLLQEVRRNRGRYVSAALTVITGWIEAGSPKAGSTPIGSFEQWSEWCREPLLWLAKPDPAASVFAAMADDPERALVGQLLLALQAHFAGAPVMVKDMVKRAHDVTKPNANELLELLREITGDRHTPNVKKLGHWVKRHAGQVVGGLKLVKSPTTRNALVWQVEPVV